VTGPRIYFPPGTSTEEQEAVTDAMRALPPRARAHAMTVIVGALGSRYAQGGGHCDVCQTSYLFWMLDPPHDHTRSQHFKVARETFTCPLCHPDPTELDKAGRIELTRALARTDAIDTMHVVLDQAMSEGRTSEKDWHNPDDLEEIAALQSRLLDLEPYG
jgi:hypothetical protein